MKYWVAYAHGAFDEESFVKLDRPTLTTAESARAAAVDRAKGLSEGSSSDGILVFGPVDNNDPEYRMYRLVPPKRNWSIAAEVIC